MSATKLKKQSKKQQNPLHFIAKEFAEKVKDNPGVSAVIAKPYGTYLNLIVLLEPNIERQLQSEVFDAYGEISDTYNGQVTFELNPMTCFSSETIDELAYDNPNHIIYRKGQ